MAPPGGPSWKDQTMKFTPDPQYAADYTDSLDRMTRRTFLLAHCVHTNRDGSRTRVVLTGVRDDGTPANVTQWAAHALGESLHRTENTPWGISCNAGGTNPVNDLQERLRRRLGLHVTLVESL